MKCTVIAKQIISKILLDFPLYSHIMVSKGEHKMLTILAIIALMAIFGFNFKDMAIFAAFLGVMSLIGMAVAGGAVLLFSSLF